ncbi:MAG: hypothetical protein M1830_000789 [Pleopsidium flavum]|nr:MAG: hypothetical protein M1830_000789 [Pleopsidium flavum]
MAPTVAASYLQGPSVNKPSTQYINWKAPGNIKLATNLLNVGVNDLLSTTYPLSLDTGILELNTSTQDLLADLVDTPHISRDGGKGGYLNGQHLFVFCDTGAYTATTGYSHGDFLGFVSSSVAVDTGMNGLSRKALTLQDGIGQWSDNVGRMRGFSPLTEGEQSYNLAMQGKGMRYAIWPESSLIPLDATNAIIYAPIVYDNVNMATKAAVFTYTGATLLAVTAGGSGGPVATRTVDKLFNQDEVEWGCIGGIRSWGNSGIGGTDGKVYIFGKVQGGLLLARTRHGNVADRNSPLRGADGAWQYEYWTGNGWTHEIQSASSTAYFISGNFMDVDVFYSPRHLTFVIVYMNTYADNTFYFRYLNADHAILPPSAPGGDPLSDYVENMVGHQWSKEEVLYKASPGTSGKYIYSGGVHQGYYGDNDITNGGSKMLLSWTAPTGGNPASESGEYQIVTAEIEWV